MSAFKSLYIVAASLLARAPNFVLPIFAARIFDFSEYSGFAVAFVTASVMSAFLGEAISATISRESYRVGVSEQGCESLAAFFSSSVFVSYLVIIAIVVGYYSFFSDVDGGIRRASLAASIILLVPAYLLPVASSALANAHGLGKISIAASCIGVPISLVISFVVGANFGVIYFFIAYFFLVVLTNGFVYFKVTPKNSRGYVSQIDKTFRSFGSVFFSVLVPFLLGGPIHGFCLTILGHQRDGTLELALFVAYYPWSLIVSVLAAVLSNFVIQKVVEINRKNDAELLGRFLRRLLFVNTIGATVISVLLWIASDYVFDLYGLTIAENQTLFNWMLVCGIAATFVSTTSQIMIGAGRGKGLVMWAIIHAVVYTTLTFIFVGSMGQGAVGLIRSLSLSLSFLGGGHLVWIGFYVRRIAVKNGFNNGFD